MSTGAILAGLDAAEWAGAELFRRGAVAVYAPALTTMHDGGHYPDAVGFINGWSADKTLSEALSSWGATGIASAYLTDGSLLRVYVVGAAPGLTIVPGADDPWGWGGAVVGVPDAFGATLTATRAYRRGMFVADESARCTLVELGWAGDFPVYLQQAQSLPHWLGIGDADHVRETLERWDNDANDAVLRRIRWGLDEEGRAWCSYPSSLNPVPIGNLTWSSDTLRVALGFTGIDGELDTDGIRTMRGTYPARGVLLLRQGLAVRDGALHRRASAADTCGGGVVGRQTAYWRDLIVSAHLRGCFGISSALPEVRDEVEIYRATVWPYLWPGQRVTVCPDWSEARMGTTRHEARAAGQPEQYCNWGGLSGRRRCVVSSAAADVHALQWPRTTGARLMVAPLTWTFRELTLPGLAA